MAVWSKVQQKTLSKRLDAEYYQPKFLEIDNKLKISNTTNLINIANVSGGKRLPKGETFSEQGIPYIRVEDINNVGYIDINKVKTISKKVWSKIKNYSIAKDDIVLTIVGNTVGLTGILQKDLGISNITENCAKISSKSRNIQNEFLFAILISKYGQLQVEREKVGTAQPKLALERLRNFKLPIFDEYNMNNIVKIVQQSKRLFIESQDLYQQATELLDKELELDTLEFEKPINYTASFSEVITNNRTDSEYYQVHFRQIEEHLKKLNTLSLGTICSYIKGYEVGSSLYTESGPIFIRVSNFTKHGFSFGDSDKHISDSTYNFFKAYKPNIGDILLTKDGTVGMCYVVDQEVEGIISSGIVNLTLLDESIPKEYLALVINSKICQMQANRDCSGALISHWKPQDIRKMKIPLLDIDTMQKINDLVVASKTALRESKQLLEQAKNRVEQLIEKASKKDN
ncbi:restriction endonuclease subunit S [Francisella philomiragia]|uniref:Type I restriction modification DNA specificity domain protein n=1 Tax=Francisella philomiragia TaxID=28110 RepID=A0A0B6D3S1_9GAMM|nr:restriction endonuclease subunit S [Francisella philomiragia]AJI53511.1 type I restriction modification DNA specificity domain protein [Francisella philomiragia]